MTTQPLRSTPALVMTIGTFMLPAIAEVKRIFFQSDSRRRATTRFLALNLSPRKNEAELIPLEQALALKSNLCSWKDVNDHAQSLIEYVKVGIRSSMQELRSHEKLIEVGLGGKNALPLDVYLIADLSEADAATLLTVLPAIQTLLANEPYAGIHILLNVAVFDENPTSIVNVFVTLNNLRAWSQSQKQFPIPQIYLFDRFKEGVWEAQNALEVQTILGNFLLSLLSGELAQYIAHQLTQTDREQHQSYFCGASAVAIVLDMEQLQKICALQLGQELLKNEFHSNVDPNPGPIQEMIENFLDGHANLRMWKKRLCSDSLFRMRTGDDGLEFHISDLEFEDVLMEDWGNSIQTYDKDFKKKRLPTQFELLNKNTAALDREFLDQMTNFAQSLPQQARLYPGGVRSARLILERLRQTLLEICPAPRVESHVEHLEKEWTEPIKTSLEWLENAIRKLPKPPPWALRLPSFLKKPTVHFFNLIYLRRELQTINDLRQASVCLLEQKYAALMDAMLAQKLIELNKGWIKSLDKHIRATKRLQSNFDAIQTRMKIEMISVISTTSLFRVSALNEILLAWAYYNGKRPQAGFRHTLLTEREFLKRWPKKNQNVLYEQLMEFCREVYQPLSEIDLDEVLSHRNGKDNGDLATALAQGAIPLLRPNFDRTGSGPSCQMRFFLSRDPRQSSALPIIKSDMQDWQEISTGDPYLVTCCRVRVMIPDSALSHVFERGRGMFDALDEETKGQYSLKEVR